MFLAKICYINWYLEGTSEKVLSGFSFNCSCHDLFKLSHVKILTRDQLGHVMTATWYSEAVVVHGRLDNNFCWI